MIDLADEPVLPASAKLRLAALALSLGLRYEAPGPRLEPPRYEPVPSTGPKLAVIGTGKRTGKTAVASHWATLLREAGEAPVIVCMGRGGPAEPRVAEASTALADLLAIAAEGGHAASDYLEDAVLAGVRTVGCRRVGGGFAGAPAESNVVAGAALAASLDPGAIVFEGSGACIPPVEVDRTVCVIGAGPARAVRRVPRRSAPTSCWHPRGRRRPPGRFPSGCGRSRPSRCRTPHAWRCSPRAARRRGRRGGGCVHQPGPPRRARSATSSALAPSAATSISSSSRRPRSTPSPRRRRPRARGSCSSATARWVGLDAALLDFRRDAA